MAGFGGRRVRRVVLAPFGGELTELEWQHAENRTEDGNVLDHDEEVSSVVVGYGMGVCRFGPRSRLDTGCSHGRTISVAIAMRGRESLPVAPLSLVSRNLQALRTELYTRLTFVFKLKVAISFKNSVFQIFKMIDSEGFAKPWLDVSVLLFPEPLITNRNTSSVRKANRTTTTNSWTNRQNLHRIRRNRSYSSLKTDFPNTRRISQNRGQGNLTWTES